MTMCKYCEKGVVQYSSHDLSNPDTEIEVCECCYGNYEECETCTKEEEELK